MSAVYDINRGINRSIEFRGLRGQYIVYFLLGLVGLLVLYAAAYMAGVPTFVCLAGTGSLGGLLYSQVYRYNNKYGEYGLMKKAAYQRVPPAIRCRNRRLFHRLKLPEHDSGNDTTQHTVDRTAAKPKR
jgi:hypothetical protein